MCVCLQQLRKVVAAACPCTSSAVVSAGIRVVDKPSLSSVAGERTGGPRPSGQSPCLWRSVCTCQPFPLGQSKVSARPRANPHRITVAIQPVPIPSAATRRRLAQLFGRRSIAARGHSGYRLQPQWPECSYLVEVAFALVSVRRAAAERQHAVAVVLVRALGAARRVEFVRVHPRPHNVRRDLPRLNRQLTTADSQRPSGLSIHRFRRFHC